MRVFTTKVFKTAGFVVLVLVALAAFAMVTGALPIRGVGMPWQPAPEDNAPPSTKSTSLGIELVNGQPHTLFVPKMYARPWEFARTTSISLPWPRNPLICGRW